MDHQIINGDVLKTLPILQHHHQGVYYFTEIWGVIGSHTNGDEPDAPFTNMFGMADGKTDGSLSVPSIIVCKINCFRSS
jgi:hypothetical protein